MVIIAFVFYTDVILYSQQGDDITKQFQRSKTEYNNGQYVNSKNRLERVIGTIKAKGLEVEKKDILGKCYLLLGAIYEKEGETLLAEENYRKAKEGCGIESIDGVDLNDLPIYKRVVKGEIPIDQLFIKARDEYNNGQYDSSKSTLERIIGTIKVEGLEVEKKDILGECYLLLGAIYEKKGETLLAKENYLKAKEEYSIEYIEGVDLDDLPLYKRVLKGEIETQEDKVIEKPRKRAKKKFPVLLVIGGLAVVAVVVMLLTKKKEEPPPAPTPTQIPMFVTSTDTLIVPEGGTATFDVRLSTQPSSDVSVSLTIVQTTDVREPDIYIQSGLTLSFTTSNWNQNQTVTIAAKEDSDTFPGSVIIRIIAVGMQVKEIFVIEKDNDEYGGEINFITDTDTVIVSEGRRATFGVRLSSKPSSNIQATVSWVSGDSDIHVQSGDTLTFTSSNWNTYQTVTLRADEDSDSTDGQAIFRISASGVMDKDITAIEDDDED